MERLGPRAELVQMGNKGFQEDPQAHLVKQVQLAPLDQLASQDRLDLLVLVSGDLLAPLELVREGQLVFLALLASALSGPLVNQEQPDSQEQPALLADRKEYPGQLVFLDQLAPQVPEVAMVHRERPVLLVLLAYQAQLDQLALVLEGLLVQLVSVSQGPQALVLEALLDLLVLA